MTKTIKEADLDLPSDLMRQRHPEQFSDSGERSHPTLERSRLEYHLETLTSRKQEYDFENFCRALLEREICPNIVPQTGPTGGGDSKMDAVTHPVSPELPLHWYLGRSVAAAPGVWAFAFSTKMKWKPKIIEDVAKIASKPTQPELIYFVSSRYIKDKDRSTLEEDLKKKHGIPVHILDRTWILARVIERGHADLAIETLHIDVPPSSKAVLGPRDASRTAELTTLTDRLSDISRNYISDYLVAEDYLRAAKLARELERPIHETTGLLAMARQAADRFGDREQITRALYDTAWTSFWWADDIDTVKQLYQKMRALLAETTEVSTLSLFGNIWILLWTDALRGESEDDSARAEEAKDELFAKLSTLAKDKTRPNRALHAKTELLTRKLAISTNEADISRIFKQLRSLIQQSDKMLFYPVLNYTNLIVELGPLIGRFPGYDELFAVVCDVSQRRTGDRSTGALRLERGMQLLASDSPLEALAEFGKARVLLTKPEARTGAVTAFAGAGQAYEQIELYWAARSELVTGISLATSGHRDSNNEREKATLLHQALQLAQRLFWLDLRLGRYPCAIAWRAFSLQLISKVDLPKKLMTKFTEDTRIQDIISGMVLLRLDDHELKDVEKLPDLLERLGFVLSRGALLHALGQDDVILKEKFHEGLDRLDEFYVKWATQPAAQELSSKVNLHTGILVEYETTVQGCLFHLTLDNDPACILLGENVLGMLEAFFATAKMTDVFLKGGRVDVRFRVRDSAPMPPPLPGSSETAIEIALPTDAINWLGDNIAICHQWLCDLLFRIVAREIVPFGGKQSVRSIFEKLAKAEAFSRALSHAPTAVSVNNTIGSDVYNIHKWTEDGYQQCPYLRRSTWWMSVRDTVFAVTKTRVDGKSKKYVNHRHRRNYNLFDLESWSKAGWRGAAFMSSPGSGEPPLLALIFKDRQKASETFIHLRGQLGGVDTAEALRISVVETDLPKQPYAINLGVDIEAFDDTASQFMTISKPQRMDPSNGTQHIRYFEQNLSEVGYFLLVPAVLMADGIPRWSDHLAIRKTKIVFRKLKDINNNDVDACVLELFDDS